MLDSSYNHDHSATSIGSTDQSAELQARNTQETNHAGLSPGMMDLFAVSMVSDYTCQFYLVMSVSHYLFEVLILFALCCNFRNRIAIFFFSYTAPGAKYINVLCAVKLTRQMFLRLHGSRQLLIFILFCCYIY